MIEFTERVLLNHRVRQLVLDNVNPKT